MIYAHVATFLAGLALAAASTWHVQAWRYDALIADMQGSYEAQESERLRVAMDDARETFRKGEIHAHNQQEIADEHAVQEKRRLARLAAAAADGERLRAQVIEYAAACGGGEADSPAAALQHCRDRAATLGNLLGKADRLAEALAGAAEQHADEVRTLMRVIHNDRTLLPPSGIGLKPPSPPSVNSQPG